MAIEVKLHEGELETYYKRIELLVGARFVEAGKIRSAIETQDRIRKKIGSWKGSDEIRKWRQQRRA